MKYTNIIDTFTWSYSRITQFENCKYCFLLKYIKSVKSEKRNFFSDYGKFMHLIIQKYLNGELKREELTGYYLTKYRKSIAGRAPTRSIFNNYFSQGLIYLHNIEPKNGNIIAVEKEVSFNIADKNFIGFIDVVSDENGIILTDNKSRALKKRTNGKKQTKSDKELDNYLKQLYIYSVAIKQELGVLPSFLRFNCFRTNTIITEPFNVDAYEEAKRWALNLIEKISDESDWNPNIDYFKCTYLCDCSDACEYYQLNK